MYLFLENVNQPTLYKYVYNMIDCIYLIKEKLELQLAFRSEYNR